jgi:hypothetical protein
MVVEVHEGKRLTSVGSLRVTLSSDCGCTVFVYNCQAETVQYGKKKRPLLNSNTSRAVIGLGYSRV